MANLETLEASVDLSEFDVAQVKRGQRVIVSVDALGGETFQGKVLFAALAGNSAGGVVTFPVRISIPEAEGLKPGMNVSVRITVAERSDVVQVPLEAVSQDEDEPTVTVIDASGEEDGRRREREEGVATPVLLPCEHPGDAGANGQEGREEPAKATKPRRTT